MVVVLLVEVVVEVVKEFRRKLSGAGRETGSFSSSLLISSLASLSDIAITGIQ